MNTYEMFLDICDWMRKNPDSPIKRELLQCKSQDDMKIKWEALVLNA
jgi:hypothetical protein